MVIARSLNQLGGIVVLLGAYGVLNGLLYLGQEIAAADDKREAEALDQELSRLEAEISGLETYFSNIEAQSGDIDAFGDGLDALSELARVEATNRFNEMVDAWNAQVPTIQARENEYDQLISEFNQKVDLYNSAAEKAYSRWWLLPIPLPRGAGRARLSQP